LQEKYSESHGQRPRWPGFCKTARKRMKVFLAFFLTWAIGTSGSCLDMGSEIAASIRAGNARELSQWFNNNVDLTVLGKEEMYSKGQAEQVLRDFFTRHPPKSFVLKHKSNNPTAAQYGIGSYLSTGNSRFRIYFLIKKIGNQSFIQQLSIEPEL